MQVARPVAAAAAALILIPLTAASALAATPDNDTAAGARPVALGQTVTENTTEATTDALDATVNAQCGAPFTNASVWFTYTDTTGGGFLADMTGSDYSGGFIVTEGNPADADLVACGPGQVGVRGAAGTTYYIVAFSDTATNGGTLSARFSALPPAPVATLTVDPKGYALKDGTAKISGTYSCTNADGYDSDIFGQLTQRVGRANIDGSFEVYPLDCDGTVHRWEAIALTNGGERFAGGKAASFTVEFACGTFDCSIAEASGTVQLSRSGR